MAATSPRQVVERYLREVLAGADPGTADELIASQAFRQQVSAFRAAFPDLALRTHVLVSEGPLVAVHLTGRGTHRGMFLGVPATGRSWAASCSAVYRVENGKLTDSWVNWDLLSILEQVGGVQRAPTASA